MLTRVTGEDEDPDLELDLEATEKNVEESKKTAIAAGLSDCCEWHGNSDGVYLVLLTSTLGSHACGVDTCTS